MYTIVWHKVNTCGANSSSFQSSVDRSYPPSLVISLHVEMQVQAYALRIQEELSTWKSTILELNCVSLESFRTWKTGVSYLWSSGSDNFPSTSFPVKFVLDTWLGLVIDIHGSFLCSIEFKEEFRYTSTSIWVLVMRIFFPSNNYDYVSFKHRDVQKTSSQK